MLTHDHFAFYHQTNLLDHCYTKTPVLAIIAPLFQIASNVVTPDNVESPTFSNVISPLLISLFTINDRGIRGALLSRFIPILASNLPPKTLNTSIFEPMCSGFTDSSPALRELTLKSCLPIVSHLTSSSLDKLCRYLIRLQNDSEASVRTNTIIFVGKIISHLSPANRSNLILPAFTRAMTDEFTPCRLAALRAVLTCKQYFDPEGIAKQVLPVVVPHLVDGVSSVRTEAYAVVDAFMIILREDSLKRGTAGDSEGAVNNSGTGGTSSSSANVSSSATASQASNTSSSGGYFSGLSSWAVGAVKSSTAPTPAPTPAPVLAPAPAPIPVNPTPESPTKSMTNLSLSEHDGWSDEEEDMDHSFDDGLEKDDMQHEPSWVSNPTPNASKLTSLEDEDDLFASAFSNTTAKPMTSNANSTAKKLITPKLNTKPKQSSTTAMSLSERKAEFEKRKLERMEKRMKQWEKGKDTSTATSSSQSMSNNRGTSNLNGWTDFSR